MRPDEIEICFKIAQAFHEAYERLAPDYEYTTQEATAKPWEDIPVKNQLLMVGVISELLDKKIIRAP